MLTIKEYLVYLALYAIYGQVKCKLKVYFFIFLNVTG